MKKRCCWQWAAWATISSPGRSVCARGAGALPAGARWRPACACWRCRLRWCWSPSVWAPPSRRGKAARWRVSRMLPPGTPRRNPARRGPRAIPRRTSAAPLAAAECLAQTGVAGAEDIVQVTLEGPAEDSKKEECALSGAALYDALAAAEVLPADSPRESALAYGQDADADPGERHGADGPGGCGGPARCAWETGAISAKK